MGSPEKETVKVKDRSENGISGGSSEDILKTYTRRKRAKLINEDGKISWGLNTQDSDNSIKLLRRKVLNKCSGSQGPHAHTNDTDKHSRNIVLEQISRTWESKGGLQECIKDAFMLNQESFYTTLVKESGRSCEDEAKSSINGSNCQSVTELCQHTFLNVITSDKFAELCHLLLSSFPEMKAEKVFDFSVINTRLQEGVYELSPNLFHTDVQQVWAKIHKIGIDMAALAKSLSEKSTTSYSQQVRNLSDNSFEVGKHNLFSLDDKAVCRCKHCGEKADGKSCLVCDSCEGMYHISCIDPAVEEIPLTSWYCVGCTSKGIGTPHEDCVICERLNFGVVDKLKDEKRVKELEEGLNEGLKDEIEQVLPICNCCKGEIENGEKMKICRHGFCPHKFYHMRCLTRKELVSYGMIWYCPSCLCRCCFTDCEDDKIVLCDGCDNAYHIFCMEPPRTSVPKGRWFCKKCDADLRKIRMAKKSMQHILIKEIDEDENEDEDKEALGMEMLLNAAKTLNFEDNLEFKS